MNHDSHHVHQGASDDGRHDAHSGRSPERFRDKFWLSFIIAVPVVLWSAHIRELLRYEAPAFPGSEWIPPALGTIVFVYGGRVPAT